MVTGSSLPPRASENTPTPQVSAQFLQPARRNVVTTAVALWHTEHMMVLYTHEHYSQCCPAHWTPTEALRRLSGRRGEAAGHLNWALMGQRGQLHSFNIWHLSHSEFLLYPVIRFGLATSSAPSLFGRTAPSNCCRGSSEGLLLRHHYLTTPPPKCVWQKKQLDL